MKNLNHFDFGSEWGKFVYNSPYHKIEVKNQYVDEKMDWKEQIKTKKDHAKLWSSQEQDRLAQQIRDAREAEQNKVKKENEEIQNYNKNRKEKEKGKSIIQNRKSYVEVKPGLTLWPIVKGLMVGKETDEKGNITEKKLKWSELKNMRVEYLSDKIKDENKPKILNDAGLIYPGQFVFLRYDSAKKEQYIVISDSAPGEEKK